MINPTLYRELLAEWVATGRAHEVEQMSSEWLDAVESTKTVAKGLSPIASKGARRRSQLVSRLKRRRKYRNPVKGGTGRQGRTRRPRF